MIERGRVMSDFFNELKSSVEEAVQIEQGIKQPVKVTRYNLAGVKVSLEDFTAMMETFEKPPKANQALTDAMHQHPAQGERFELSSTAPAGQIADYI